MTERAGESSQFVIESFSAEDEHEISLQKVLKVTASCLRFGNFSLSCCPNLACKAVGAKVAVCAWRIYDKMKRGWNLFWRLSLVIGFTSSGIDLTSRNIIYMYYISARKIINRRKGQKMCSLNDKFWLPLFWCDKHWNSTPNLHEILDKKQDL